MTFKKKEIDWAAVRSLRSEDSSQSIRFTQLLINWEAVPTDDFDDATAVLVAAGSDYNKGKVLKEQFEYIVMLFKNSVSEK